jgi:hypothetical protein
MKRQMSQRRLNNVKRATRALNPRYSLAQTVDGEWMILIDGVQWGRNRDLSGAGDATFKTRDDAMRVARVI